MQRLPAAGALTVLRGFDAIVASLTDGMEGAAESWKLNDLAASGVGASLPAALARGLEQGLLLALRLPGEARRQIGVLRRRQRVEDGCEVGIELLGAALACPTFLAGSLPFPSIELDALLAGVPARFLVPSGLAVKEELRFAPGVGARALAGPGRGAPWARSCPSGLPAALSSVSCSIQAFPPNT